MTGKVSVKKALYSVQKATDIYHQLVHPAIRTVVHHHRKFLEVIFLFLLSLVSQISHPLNNLSLKPFF